MEPDELAPQDDPNKARIRKNVETMHGKGASDVEIETYLRDVEGLKPVGQSAPADPMAQTHADFKSGALQAKNQRLDRAGQREVANVRDTEPTFGERFGGAMSEGLSAVPGGKAVMGGVRALTRGQSFLDAVGDIEGAQESAPAAASVPMKIAGNVASFGALGKLGKLAGVAADGWKANAALGAAQAGATRALDTRDESLKDWLAGTVEDTALGAGLGVALPGLAGSTAGRTALGAAGGAYAGAKAAPDGHGMAGGIGGALAGGAAGYTLPSAVGGIASLFEKIGAKRAASGVDALAQASGTRGVVNREIEGQDRIAKVLGLKVGADPKVATQLANDLAEGKAIASPAYGVASNQAHEVELAPAKAASAWDKIKTIAGRKQLPAPGQSEVAKQEIQGAVPKSWTAAKAGEREVRSLEQAGTDDYTNVQQPGEPFTGNGLHQRDFTVERPVQVRAADDVGVRGPEGVPKVEPSLSPAAGGMPNRFQMASDASETALANPFVAQRLKQLTRSSGPLAGKDPTDYDVLHSLYKELNAEYGTLKKSPGGAAGQYWNDLNAARSDVHEALVAKAPSIDAANALYAEHVGAPQEFIPKGFNVSPKSGLKKSADVITAQAAQGASPQQVLAQQAAAQKGARLELQAALANQGPAGGRRAVVENAMFAPTGPAKSARDLANLPNLEKVLRQVDVESANDAPISDVGRGVLSHVLSRVSRGTMNVAPTKALAALQSGTGRGMVRDVTADPEAYQSVLQQYGRGKSSLSMLEQLAAVLAGQQAGRP